MYRERNVVGGDTETVKGKPYTFQLYSKEKSVMKYTNSKRIWNDFLDAVFTFPDNSIFYFHNLEFDLPILFFPFLDSFKESSFSLEAKEVSVKILYGKVCYAEINLFGKHYEIVDTFAYFKSSLAMLAKTFKLSRKLEKPDGLGERRYNGKERAYFEKYAMEDARITYELGILIQQFHLSYNVHRSISGPNLAAGMFKKYIPRGKVITPNPRELEDAAVLSYHGGKNTMAVSPGIYKNVALYDINSAYPFAMSRLPNFLNCRYEWIKKFNYRAEGIFCVSGVSIPHVYNPLRDHNFKDVVGPFEKIWITSYELKTLIEHKFLSEYQVHEGFIVKETKEKVNPLKEYALYFYDKKQNSKGVEREFFKLMLNSLYGKFIQTTKNETNNDNVYEETQYYQAGGLWNPLLATMITGFVRSYLTELEIRYKSYHSSTDSLLTHAKINTGIGIGQLALKIRGDSLLLRPKFYLIWTNGELKTYATHGYHGDLKSLFKMLRKGNRDYFHFHMTKLKESYVQKKTPFIMEELAKTINIPITEKLVIPKLRWTNPLTEKTILL